MKDAAAEGKAFARNHLWNLVICRCSVTFAAGTPRLAFAKETGTLFSAIQERLKLMYEYAFCSGSGQNS